MRIRRTIDPSSREGKVIIAVTLLVTAFFLLRSVWTIIRYHSIKDELVTVEAVIEQIDVRRGSKGKTRRTVYVSYDYDGTQYDRVKIPSYKSGMEVGGTTLVELHPDAPGTIVSSGSPVAAIFLAVWMGMFGYGALSKKGKLTSSGPGSASVEF